MSAIPLEYTAIPTNERIKKRKRHDDPEIYDSNGKTRRVNPYKLGERLGPDLVREMEVYIKPGAMMPNFAIRKHLQEKYQVDRRHLYDYFHSRGLRVAKEDRHSNLTRSRQAKAAAAAAEDLHPVARKARDFFVALAKKPEQKRSQKPKAARPPLVQASVNVSSSPSTRAISHGDKPSEDGALSISTISSIYAHEDRQRSLSPEPAFSQNDPSDGELQYPASDDSYPSASHAISHSTSELPAIEILFSPLLSSSTSYVPSNIAEWLAKRTTEESSTPDHSPEVTLVDDEAGSFSPADFVKETLDPQCQFNLEDYINFDDGDLVAPSTPGGFGLDSDDSIINMEESMSLSERRQFYDLVNDVFAPLEATQIKSPPKPGPTFQKGSVVIQPADILLRPAEASMPSNPYPDQRTPHASAVKPSQDSGASATPIAHVLPKNQLVSPRNFAPPALNYMYSSGHLQTSVSHPEP
ncbi:hypothetical protein V5O48_005105 [Marasmius crinis-equi]|uniref:Clr5 domain-containing protein n=1 Tax=Marasmius crinis-equi TaxID=585013 RepID=A0ABR3FN71_9AGAR